MEDFCPAVVGSLSEGAAGNPTVAMIEAGFRHHRLAARYLNAEVAAADLGAAVAGARAMGWIGFNLSIPHKVAVIEHLDGLGESAAAIGAVNCVVRQPDGRYIGENTDGKGFVASLTSVRPPAGAHVVIVGAGGAARAIAVELILAGATSFTIVNRSPARANDLRNDLRDRLGFAAAVRELTDGYRVPEGTDVLVNATSVGLYQRDAMIPIDVASLDPSTVVADVVFNPVDTALLLAAAAGGCPTVDGLGMLVEQGALAIAYWTGIEPDRSVLRAALVQATSST